MKIISAKTIQIKKWVRVFVLHKGRKIELSVQTMDGKVLGERNNGLYTSYLTYFNDTPKHIQDKHWEEIKNHVERYIK